MDTPQRKKEKSLIIGLVGLIIVIIILAMIGFFMLKPGDETIQGQAEATQVRVSGKLPGRIVEFMVEDGQSVHKGDTLVRIFSSDAEAKLMQASAMENVYKAQNQKVDKGARIEVINSAYDMWQKAIAGLDIAKKSYDRMQALFKKGVISAQKRDEAEANYNAMKATESAAKSQYEMAKKGAQIEDKEAAAAMLLAAKGSVAQVESVLADSYLTAPIDGEISDIFPNEGELVGTGAPIMNVLNLNDMWVTFNVREELLQNLTMGKEIPAIIPALGNKEITLKIYYIKDLGTYAVWRATKVSGQYDAKTFQIKARPTAPVENLRPGMSVLLIKLLVTSESAIFNGLSIQKLHARKKIGYKNSLGSHHKRIAPAGFQTDIHFLYNNSTSHQLSFSVNSYERRITGRDSHRRRRSRPFCSIEKFYPATRCNESDTSYRATQQLYRSSKIAAKGRNIRVLSDTGKFRSKSYGRPQTGNIVLHQ